ncbi:MAG: hypothetical protein KAY32_15910 [Candidatus Eisenbacteria sp.]|nr:hypothetical protein [Candidatus Eisenbacteria bacterium]
MKIGRCVLVAAGILLIASIASAEPPRLVNYQGVLTDTGGEPLSGPRDLTFRIYPDSASATPDLWSEEHLGVELTDGLFHVILGSVINLPDDLFGSAERWLGVQVGGDPEMTPRMRMTSVPYALRAAVADSALVGVAVADADWVITGRDMYAAVPGSVGVGTSDPLARLHVVRVDRDVPLEALLQEDLLVEDSDAFLGLYSSTGGAFGSGISFGEVSDGALTNKWTIVRTTGENGTLRFKFGTDPNYSNNSTIVKMAGGATATAQLDVAGTLEADGFRMPTGAVSGHVLKSDASGVGTWQSVGSVITDDDWVIDGDDMYSGVTGTVGIGTTSHRGKLAVIIDSGTAAYISNSAPSPNNTAELGTEDHAVEGYGAIPFYAEGDSAGLYAKHSVSRVRATLATQDIAVLGENDNGSGTEGYLGGDVYGVYGYSPDSCGVAGVSSTSHGVYGKSEGYAGVWGEALIGVGVRGYHIGNGNEGSLAGPSYGVYGQSTSDDPGVLGYSPDGEGVYGQSINGYGVFGRHYYGNTSGWLGGASCAVGGENDASDNSGFLGGPTTAVRGSANNGVGVYGEHNQSGSYGFLGGVMEDGLKIGVYGESDGNGCGGYFKGCWHGIHAEAVPEQGYANYSAVVATVTGGTETNNGVYAYAGGSDTDQNFAINALSGFRQTDYAGFFGGQLYAWSIESPSKAFKIDHPLDPENKYFRHSCVESADMMNVYNGNVTLGSSGEAWIELPDWFEVINRDFRYQLTALGGPGPNLHVAEEIAGNRFKIAGGQPGMKVSWQVTGIRHDPVAEAHRIVVEEDKPAAERGKFLNPEVYGKPRSMALGYVEEMAAGRVEGWRGGP